MNEKEPLRNKSVRVCKRAAKGGLIATFAFILVLVVGLIPVNNHFRPSTQGVKIYLVSNAVHADIIVPINSDKFDWRKPLSGTRFVGDVSDQTHIAFGWGDKGFFLETETWNDLKFSTAANALFLPTTSCMHVSFIRPEYLSDKVAVTISPEQYARLVSFIDSSFAKNAEGESVQIEGYAYADTDAFFESHGWYHIFNTCNSWVGRALKFTGVRTPWFSPLPRTPMLYIQSEDSPR